MLGKIVSFQPVVYYNKLYLVMIGVVAFLTQLQLLHLLRYHKTISILGATLSRSLVDLISFGFIMGIIFIAFAIAIYLLYHDLIEYSSMANTMGSQVRTSPSLSSSLSSSLSDKIVFKFSCWQVACCKSVIPTKCAIVVLNICFINHYLRYTFLLTKRLEK